MKIVDIIPPITVRGHDESGRPTAAEVSHREYVAMLLNDAVWLTRENLIAANRIDAEFSKLPGQKAYLEDADHKTLNEVAGRFFGGYTPHGARQLLAFVESIYGAKSGDRPAVMQQSAPDASS